MSDFEKEKQAFNEWYNGNPDDSWFFVNNTKSLDRTKRILFGFYGGYHSRDEEINRLRAEIERKNRALQFIYDSAGIDWLPHDDDRKLVEEALYIMNPPEKPDSSQALQNKEE